MIVESFKRGTIFYGFYEVAKCEAWLCPMQTTEHELHQ